MIYYRCKCMHVQHWSSMGVPKCSWCDKCNSTPAASPIGHRDIKTDHDFSSVQMVRTDEGPKPLTRCRYCHRTKDELAKLEEL